MCFYENINVIQETYSAQYKFSNYTRKLHNFTIHSCQFKCIKIDLNFFLMQINTFFYCHFGISQAKVRYFPEASNLNYDLTIRQTNLKTSEMQDRFLCSQILREIARKYMSFESVAAYKIYRLYSYKYVNLEFMI